MISPLVGAMMDWITAQQGRPNYVASFVIADIMLLCSFLAALKIDMDLELPINKDAMKGLRSILTNFEILLFLVMMFICGIMYGFVETFLFVFLKEDLHAPMYLLGLTITTGAVVSLPFLYYSDAIVKKVTFQNCLNKRNKRTTNNIAQLKYLKISTMLHVIQNTVLLVEVEVKLFWFNHSWWFLSKSWLSVQSFVSALPLTAYLLLRMMTLCFLDGSVQLASLDPAHVRSPIRGLLLH